jgi:hypothetical protein
MATDSKKTAEYTIDGSIRSGFAKSPEHEKKTVGDG